MTTVENLSGASTLLRPTDLSIKTCLSKKYSTELHNSTGSPVTGFYNSLERQGTPNSWKCNHQAEAITAALPTPLVFDKVNFGTVKKMTSSSVLDSATKLVMLDSLLSQYKSTTPMTSSTPLFDASPCKLGSRENSDSSREIIPVKSTFLDAIQDSLAELQRRQTKIDGSCISPTSISTTSARPIAASNTSSAGRWQGCKRKGGWKFHDFSDESDSLGRKKRTYCHNRLENEILQLYQDRICIKEVLSAGASKLGDRLVVIEPTYITDPDLVKHNTGLRIVLDKKRGSYKLQMLPFTIEQGSLSDKSQALSAVAKMLGENGAILCPGITRALLTPHLYQVKKRLPDKNQFEASARYGSHHNSPITLQAKKKWLGSTPVTSDSSSDGESSMERYRVKWKIMNSLQNAADNKRTPSPLRLEQNDFSNSAITSTDKLLLTLNKELSQRKLVTSPEESQTLTNRCLLWHVPTTGGKGKRTTWPQEAKWCSNCLREIRGAGMLTPQNFS